MNCPICEMVMDPVLLEVGLKGHPDCLDSQTRELEERNDELKSQLLEIIGWADANSPRSQQVAIGPSEVGLDCDQRVARILAGLPEVNKRFDPWAGIVGTSIHSWLQQAVDKYLADGYTGIVHWLTESRVTAASFLSGSSDLYTGDESTGEPGDVVDYKSAAADKIKAMRTKGREAIAPQYIVQGHIYGLGQENAGRKVRDIVLVFVPRNGLIKDMYLYREPYDVNIALAAIDRVYRLVDEMTAAGLPDGGDWNVIERKPSGDCWYCPAYNESLELPDATGCPGNARPPEERLAKSIERFTDGLL